MPNTNRPASEEVDQLLLNARLRDELEPFIDESITRLNVHRLPTSVENQYLASMLAWERAPVLPIAEWFQPPLELPPPDTLDDESLHALLWKTIQALFQEGVALDHTDHLSDRQLYGLIRRDILPAPEKKLPHREAYLHWDCCGDDEDNPVIWLRYYASDEERDQWSRQMRRLLPPREDPPYPRNLPR